MTLDEYKKQATMRATQKSTPARPISEGEERKIPKFVRDCVSAIVAKPDTLRRVLKKGSPFGICQAMLNRNPSLDAQHAQGEHHSKHDFEKALKVLRQKTEELRTVKPPHSQVVFETDDVELKGLDRRLVVFRPEED